VFPQHAIWIFALPRKLATEFCVSTKYGTVDTRTHPPYYPPYYPPYHIPTIPTVPIPHRTHRTHCTGRTVPTVPTVPYRTVPHRTAPGNLPACWLILNVRVGTVVIRWTVLYPSYPLYLYRTVNPPYRTQCTVPPYPPYCTRQLAKYAYQIM
jgi:hypothetical protein